jgi:hypothetical protein
MAYIHSAPRVDPVVPAEPLWDVFTPEVIADLQQVRSPSKPLRTRLAILHAGGLNPSPLNREMRAFKAAWEAYLTAAFAIGLFHGEHGADLRARLTGIDDPNFFSAISECFAAWYLAGHRRLELRPRPAGKGKRCLEFSIKCDSGDINVEVKAPRRPLTEEFFWGDDSDLLEGALKEANKQLSRGQRNLLVVHPRLRLSIFPKFCRMPIERAFVGEGIIRIPLTTTGGPAGPAHTAFTQNGRLLKRWPKPRYTRVSAALFLNEHDDGGEVKPHALIIHNPNAEIPLPHEMWQGIPEFFLDGNRWRWSDEGNADA